MIFKSKHIQTMVRNSQVEDVSLDSGQTSSSPIFIPTSNKCSTTRVYAQIIGCEESTQPWLCDKQRAKVKLRGQNFAEDKHAQLLALQMLRKNSTFLMLDLLDLQNFAAQAQQLTKKLSSLPDPPVVRRGADLFG